MFTVVAQSAHSLVFSLKSNAHTRTVYPFDFDFRIHYQLTNNALTVAYEVINASAETLYFSVGGHPAFRVPLVADTTYEDYYLELNQPENLQQWPLTNQGLIAKEPLPSDGPTQVIPLAKTLFYKDALVFKHWQASKIALHSQKTSRGLEMDFAGFPYFGIWAAPNADFVCLEPWCGIADSVDTKQQLIEKEGIEQVPSGEVWKKNWQLTLW